MGLNNFYLNCLYFLSLFKFTLFGLEGAGSYMLGGIGNAGYDDCEDDSKFSLLFGFPFFIKSYA